MTKNFGESYIVITDDILERIEFLKIWQNKHEIKNENVFILKESPIKITHIREIKKKLSLKPTFDEIVLVALQDAQNMTREAQNAFLKILEEPPYYAHIILMTKNVYGLLPTIVSRCKKIHIPRKFQNKIPNEYFQIYDAVRQSSNIFEKYIIASQIIKNDKIDIELFLKYYIYYIKNQEKIDYTKIKYIDKYKNLYKSGINKKLFIENLLITI